MEPHGGELERVRVRERGCVSKKKFFGAMKPLCPDCGDRHWLHQAHVFKPSVNTEKATVNTETVPVNTGLSVNAGVNADRHSPGYMREYMKVYRAVKSGRAEFINRREK